MTERTPRRKDTGWSRSLETQIASVESPASLWSLTPEPETSSTRHRHCRSRPLGVPVVRGLASRSWRKARGRRDQASGGAARTVGRPARDLMRSSGRQAPTSAHSSLGQVASTERVEPTLRWAWAPLSRNLAKALRRNRGWPLETRERSGISSPETVGIYGAVPRDHPGVDSWRSLGKPIRRAISSSLAADQDSCGWFPTLQHERRNASWPDLRPGQVRQRRATFWQWLRSIVFEVFLTSQSTASNSAAPLEEVLEQPPP